MSQEQMNQKLKDKRVAILVANGRRGNRTEGPRLG